MVKMNNVDIEEEINVLIDKVSEQLKTRIKKIVERNQKLTLKQYIASQKETRKDTNKLSSTKAPSLLASGRSSESKMVPVKKGVRHKKDYDSSDSEDSD